MTNQEEARLEALRAERDRLFSEADRISKEIKRVEADIGWVRFHVRYPMGSIQEGQGGSGRFEVTGYTDLRPKGIQLKADGTRSTRPERTLYWLS